MASAWAVQTRKPATNRISIGCLAVVAICAVLGGFNGCLRRYEDAYSRSKNQRWADLPSRRFPIVVTDRRPAAPKPITAEQEKFERAIGSVALGIQPLPKSLNVSRPGTVVRRPSAGISRSAVVVAAMTPCCVLLSDGKRIRQLDAAFPGVLVEKLDADKGVVVLSDGRTLRVGDAWVSAEESLLLDMVKEEDKKTWNAAE